MLITNHTKAKIAFWDDYELITVCLPKHADEVGTHRFFITGKDETDVLAYLTTIERHEDSQFFYFKLYIEDGLLEFGKNYTIATECQYVIPLTVGGIVRTERFDEQFYTDLELGAIYTPEKTTFRVWAPTAVDVILSVFTPNDNTSTMLQMARREKGVYEVVVDENCERLEYHYVLNVNQKWVNASDPYAKSSTANGDRSVVVDMRRFDQEIQAVNNLPEIKNYTDAIIYELSVRDFTDNPAFQNRGKFLGLTERGLRDEAGNEIGLDYISSLGITHVQLLPVYDFGSVDEKKSIDDQYNWGYDPEQYNVPEGSYSTDPNDPYARIFELKKMISAFHSIGVRVNMDVVYNHVYKQEEYSFSKIVPYYYYRYLPTGEYANATGCGNDVASERRMVRRFIIDSVLFWQKEYQMDGFRFDLMGILDVTTMRQLTEKLRSNDSNCMIYGEGWDMPTPLFGVKATMQNHQYMRNIAYFNDYFRDVMRGENSDLSTKGFISGNEEKIEEAMNAIVSSLGLNGERMIFDEPQKTINYIECHDNHTLYDRLVLAMENQSEDDIRAAHRLGTAIVLLSQGIAFLHSGQEVYRTKQGVENSYNSPIEINRFDWEMVTKNQENINFVKELINFRKKYSLLRLRTSDRIKSRVSIMKTEDNVICYETIKDDKNFVVYLNPTKESKYIDTSDMKQLVLTSREAEAGVLAGYSLAIYRK